MAADPVRLAHPREPQYVCSALQLYSFGEHGAFGHDSEEGYYYNSPNLDGTALGLAKTLKKLVDSHNDTFGDIAMVSDHGVVTAYVTTKQPKAMDALEEFGFTIVEFETEKYSKHNICLAYMGAAALVSRMEELLKA